MPRGWGGVIFFSILDLRSILRLEVRVGLVLRFLGVRVVESLDGFTNVVEHGKMHLAVVVVPVEVHSEVPAAFPFM